MYFSIQSIQDLDESTYVPLNNELGLAYKLNLTCTLLIGNWTWSVEYPMVVRDSIVSGSLLRGVVTATAVWSDATTTTTTMNTTPSSVTSRTRTLASDYVIVPTGSVTVMSDSPSDLPIMAGFTAQVVFSSSLPYSLDADIEGYTSSETISKEVRLTLQEMLVLVNTTRGISSSGVNDLQKTHASIQSSLGSYQNDVGVLDLPLLTVAPDDTLVADNVTGPELAVNVTVRVEDYSLLQDGDRWPVHLGISFHGNAIWVGVIYVTIEAPEVRVPVLLGSTEQTGQCAYDGMTSVDLETIVQHNVTSSTGTAYNVTFNLYLPPYLYMTENSFTKPKENNITVIQEDTVISVEIARLTFSDPFVLHITLAADLSNAKVKEATHRTIVYEVLYNDRWGNRTDMMTELAYLPLTVDKLCSKRLTWTNRSDCACQHDGSRSDCGCCVGGACQCGEPRPHACAPCDEMWRCVTYKPGFEELTHLESQDIWCDSYYMRRGRASASSCHKIISGKPDLYIELSPVVGVVTAMDKDTGYFYGIANNGRSYVMSKDGGVTWGHVFDEEYANFTSAAGNSIEWAEFVTPDV
ncbi:hypothetical protein ElyMa_003496700 [Elysia marginata]|uniref:Uncharacterized protein n=1 Tax=Elysia marginata TaxID=1093978 RepID=A0AAV4EDR5_9GAST|nr:hypothetical protein ElyMa_003496700 [Elysia marginata]